MKKTLLTQLFTLLLCSLATFSLQAQIPKLISYQGLLTDVGGAALANGDYAITINIYDVDQGGMPLWSESRTVTLTNGIFHILLGEITPLDLPFDQLYYLGTNFAGNDLMPRTAMAASPYSINSIGAENAANPYALDAFGGGTQNVVFVDATTAVGIGTETPDFSTKLDILHSGHNVAKFRGLDGIGSIIELIGNPDLDGKNWGLFSTASSAGEGPGNFLLKNITDGNVEMTVTGDGNFGLGTIFPQQKLHVNGNIQVANDGNIFSLDGLWGFNDLRFFATPNSPGSTTGGDMILSANGDLGIGVFDPLTRLHVKGLLATDANLFLEPGEWNSAGDYSTIYFGDFGHYIRGEFDLGMQFYDVNKFTFLGSSLVIPEAGNGRGLGLGLDQPTALFDALGVDGRIRMHPYFGGPNGTTLVMGLSANQVNGVQMRFASDLLSEFVDIGTDPNGSFVIEQSDAPVFNATTAGNVGIGIASPGAKLHVNGDLITEERVYLGEGIFWGNSKLTSYCPPTGDWHAGYFETNAGNGPLPTVRIVNETDGNALEVLKGEVYKPGGGPWLAVSDKRLKMNIRQYQDGLEVLRSINPVRYHYNGKEGLSSKPEYIGVIAQEVEKIAPYMISEYTGKEGKANYLTVDPSAFTYMLINAMKEQDEIIQQQQALLQQYEEEKAALENKVVEMETNLLARLSALEAQLKKN